MCRCGHARDEHYFCFYSTSYCVGYPECDCMVYEPIVIGNDPMNDALAAQAVS